MAGLEPTGSHNFFEVSDYNLSLYRQEGQQCDSIQAKLLCS